MRIFIAIFPPPEVQATLFRAARDLPIDGNVRQVRQENIHLTLKFLGETEKDSLENIRSILRETARRHEPIHIQLSGLGAFPSERKARVLWSGVEEGSARLSSLVADLEDGLYSLGFEREGRNYKPHATLGRVRGRPARLPKGYEVRPSGFTARRLNLVESVLGPEGATYEKLESYALSDKP